MGTEATSEGSDRLDVLSIGSWAIFDHIAKLQKYPDRGMTIEILTPLGDIEQAHFGDCSANVAAMAASLGVRTGLAMVVGDDFVSSGYELHLRELGVQLSAVRTISGRRSGHNFLYYAPGGDDFCLSQLGVAQHQDEWIVPTDEIERARIVVISEKFSDYTLGSIRHARATGATTAINGMVGTAGSLAHAFLAEADMLFISASEARQLCDALGVRRVTRILEFGPKHVFLTQGVAGSEVLGEGVRHRIPVVNAEVIVDVTGAGDAYVAGTLASLARGLSVEEAAHYGAAAASFAVQALGAQGYQPTVDELAQRLEGAVGGAT